MGRTSTGPAANDEALAPESFPQSILHGRWLLVIAVTALLAFGRDSLPTPTEYGLVGAMILSSLVLALLRARGWAMTQALEVVTVADALAVTLVVSWTDPTPATYLVVLAGLVMAMAVGSVGLVMLMMLAVCGAYATYLYNEVGTTFWRQVEIAIRVPFIFATALHFATIASYLKRVKGEREEIVARARRHAERADHLSREQDRLQALSRIGRVALSSPDATPVRVLLEMAHRAQRALGATRCSLIVFPRDAQQRRWNGRTKDRHTEVRALDAGIDELRAILTDGKMTELNPGDDVDLMAKVKPFFPDSNPFGSLLVAPVEVEGTPAGVLFLIDTDNQRRYSGAERDFFWTVALMTGAFIHARGKLENEVQLRTLITHAPVIMFAVDPSGTITLFEGRGASVLSGSPRDRIGRALPDIVGNPEEVREAFDRALEGRIATGAVSLEGKLFETQYSPLRGLDGQITGVMGVTTAVLDAPAPRARSRPTARPKPARRSTTARTRPSETPRRATASPAELEPGRPAGASMPRRRPASPGARPDLEPSIPFADDE